MAKITQAEQTYIELDRLTSGGMSFADAVRKVAADTGKKEGAIRANFYNHKKKLEGGAPATTTGRRGRPKAQTLTVDGALAQARAILEQALQGIDREVDAVKAELEAVQARHDALVASVKDRKTELQQKIKALS